MSILDVVYVVVGIIGVILFLVSVIKGLGIVIISEDQVGIVTKKISKSSLPAGRIIALNGEAGIQADTLSPGWHFFLWPVFYKVEKVPLMEIIPGNIGLISTIDGNSISSNRLLGKVVNCDNFQNARAFLMNGGEKGRQLGILTAGRYRINTALFKVERQQVTTIQADQVGIVTVFDGAPLDTGDIAAQDVGGHNNFQDAQKFIDNGGKRGLQEKVVLAGSWNFNPWFMRLDIVPMTTVQIGHVGVVTSYIGKTTEDLSGKEFKHGNLVAQGSKGIWQKPIYPGKYALNTKVMKVDIIPTTNVVLNWANGRTESHKYDEHLSTITVQSKDGFRYNLDVSVIIHIDHELAAQVILRMGSLDNLISQVLEPMIANYFRNSAQKDDALDFLKFRTEMQKKAFEYVKEALSEHDIRVIDVLIGDVNIPAPLIQTQTERKLAEEMKQTFKTQEESQKQRESLERQAAITASQPLVVKSEQEVKISQLKAEQEVKASEGQTKVNEQKALQAVRIAEAEANATKAKADAKAFEIRAISEAEAAGVLAKGKSNAESYQLGAKAMGERNYTLLKTMEVIGKEHVKVIPDLVINSANGGQPGMELMNMLLVQMLEERMKKTESKEVKNEA